MSALGRLGYDPGHDFIREWVVVAEPRLGTFKAQELSISLYGLSKLFVPINPLPLGSFVDTWVVAAREQLPSFNAQNLANSISGLVKLGYDPDKAFLEQWVREAGPLLYAFKPQEVSNSLNALAKLKANPGKRRTVVCFVVVKQGVIVVSL